MGGLGRIPQGTQGLPVQALLPGMEEGEEGRAQGMGIESKGVIRQCPSCQANQELRPAVRVVDWESRSPFNRAVAWYVLGMAMGLVMEWSEGWHSTEQTFQSMISIGLICASLSLIVSYAKFTLAAATLRLLKPKDEDDSEE